MAAKRWVVLLRGINVGGRNKVPMAELRMAAETAGFDQVRTYIQSGNLLLTSPLSREKVALAVEELLVATFDVAVPVVVRSTAELEASVAANPYLADEAANLAWVHTYFLADTPDPSAVAALDPDRSPPDVFAVAGKEVFVHYRDGVAKSKVTANWLGKELATLATARNAKTIAKIIDLAREPPS